MHRRIFSYRIPKKIILMYLRSENFTTYRYIHRYIRVSDASEIVEKKRKKKDGTDFRSLDMPIVTGFT